MELVAVSKLLITGRKPKDNETICAMTLVSLELGSKQHRFSRRKRKFLCGKKLSAGNSVTGTRKNVTCKKCLKRIKQFALKVDNELDTIDNFYLGNVSPSSIKRGRYK